MIGETINLTREEIDVLATALKTAVAVLGYTMYDFGGENFLAPIPDHIQDDNHAAAMFAIWKKEPK